MKEEMKDIVDFIEVKEEILDYKQDTVFEDSSIPTEENLEPSYTSSQVSCINYPIVYTTRVEEMHIFKKDLNNLPSQNIINDVIAESKPKVRQFIENIKRNESSVSKFLRLLRTLQQYNYMVSKACKNSSEFKKNTVSIRSEPQDESKCRGINKIQLLLDLCKPLTVKLIDCKKFLKYRNCTKYKRSASSDKIGKCSKLQNTDALNINNEVSNEKSKVGDDIKKNFNKHVSSLFEAYTNVLLLKNAEYNRSLELYSSIRSATHPPPLIPLNKPSKKNVVASTTNKDEAINNTKKRKQPITTEVEPTAKRNALNNNSSNKKARSNTTSSRVKHVTVQSSDTVPQEQTKPITPNNILTTNNTLKSTNSTKKQNKTTTTKSTCQKINASNNKLSDKPAILNTSSVSSQTDNVTVQTSCMVPQEHTMPMVSSNAPLYPFSPAVNQPNYQYFHAMAQVMSLTGPVAANFLPVLLPLNNGTTNSIVSSVPQNGSLLQFVPSSTDLVPENLSSKIPQESDITLPTDLTTKGDDDDCILGI